MSWYSVAHCLVPGQSFFFFSQHIQWARAALPVAAFRWRELIARMPPRSESGRGGRPPLHWEIIAWVPPSPHKRATGAPPTALALPPCSAIPPFEEYSCHVVQIGWRLRGHAWPSPVPGRSARAITCIPRLSRRKSMRSTRSCHQSWRLLS